MLLFFFNFLRSLWQFLTKHNMYLTALWTLEGLSGSCSLSHQGTEHTNGPYFCDLSHLALSPTHPLPLASGLYLSLGSNFLYWKCVWDMVGFGCDFYFYSAFYFTYFASNHIFCLWTCLVYRIRIYLPFCFVGRCYATLWLGFFCYTLSNFMSRSDISRIFYHF